MTRRFNAYVLMTKLCRSRGGRHLSKSGERLAWERGMNERLGTWREPMARKRPAGRRKVWRLAQC